MKIIIAATTLATAVAASEQGRQGLSSEGRRHILSQAKPPHRLAYASLTTGCSPLLPALSRDGLVSITSIPNFSTLKRHVMDDFADCLAESRDVASVVFPDGTIRRSFAMGDSYVLPSTPSCRAWDASLAPFRSAIDSVVEEFARCLSAEMGSFLMQPLLTGRSNGEAVTWNTVYEVVSGREYLDHFHSYHKIVDGKEKKTMEFHVDQGLFLAFTPGWIRGVDGFVGISKGFYVRDSVGSEYELMLDESDDLVIMIGDGVNQVINSKLTKDKSIKSLHVTPHALSLNTQQDLTLSRLWFGRMMLLPKDAFVSSSDDTTFGQIRQNVIQHFSTNNNSVLGIGCSSSQLQIGLHGISSSRDLQECAEDELFCWFKCMPLADYGLTATTCSERSLKLQCANPRDQVSDGAMHGDFYPACTNSTNPVTDYPLIEQQDNLTCPDLWEEFVTTEDEYDHMVELTVAGGAETHFMWSLTDDNKIKARLAHNNVFGWLAMGFAGPDGGHNGMLGGQILLATPYRTENYSPVTGLDTSNEPSIGTYIIDANNTAFRHWQDPIENDEAFATVASFESSDCSTAISFESSHINGREFNTNGTDEMIWAGNSVDYYMGYHGPLSRMRFTIDWKSGEVTTSSILEEESHEESQSEQTLTDNESTISIEEVASDLASTDGKPSSVDAAEIVSGAPSNNILIWVIWVLVAGIGVFV